MIVVVEYYYTTFHAYIFTLTRSHASNSASLSNIKMMITSVVSTKWNTPHISMDQVDHRSLFTIIARMDYARNRFTWKEKGLYPAKNFVRKAFCFAYTCQTCRSPASPSHNHPASTPLPF